MELSVVSNFPAITCKCTKQFNQIFAKKDFWQKCFKKVLLKIFFMRMSTDLIFKNLEFSTGFSYWA